MHWKTGRTTVHVIQLKWKNSRLHVAHRYFGQLLSSFSSIIRLSAIFLTKALLIMHTAQQQQTKCFSIKSYTFDYV